MEAQHIDAGSSSQRFCTAFHTRPTGTKPRLWDTAPGCLKIAFPVASLALVSLLTVVLPVPARAAATLNVGVVGCSDVLGTPYCHIQVAIDAASAGDTINVAAGTYVETVTAGHGGVTAGDPGIDINKAVILKGAGAASTTIQANGGHCLPTSCPGGNIQAVTLSSSGITIDGFTILETSPPVNLITADGPLNSNNHTITNNVIVNPAFDDGNTGGGWGILLGYGPSSNNNISGNDISLNPDLTKNQWSFGIWDGAGAGGPSNNNVMNGNTIHNVGTGIILDPGTGNVVAGNHFLDNAYTGIYHYGDTGTQVTLNSFQRNHASAIQVRYGAKDIVVTGNCFQHNGESPVTYSPCSSGCTDTAKGAIRIADDGLSTTGTQIHNNNFAANTPYAVNDESSASTNTDHAAENNWWGCPVGANGGGTCDATTANVDAVPFLIAPSATPPCSCTADAQCPVDGNPCTDDICAAAVNLAQGKTATQSSTLTGYDTSCGGPGTGPPAASRAVDGNTNGDYYTGCSVAVTQNESQPWWQVDLGASQNIASINVWNRTDANTTFLTNFHVLVSNNPLLLAAGTLAAAQAVADNDFVVLGQAGTPTTILVNLTERYVRVQLAGSNYLQLAEVQVMAVGSCNPNNTAPCDDGNLCNGTDTCSGGTCVHSGDPCLPLNTSDAICSESCDPATGLCTAPDPDGTGCNDGLACDGADQCGGGTCSVHASSCAPVIATGQNAGATTVTGLGRPNLGPTCIQIFDCGFPDACQNGNDTLIGTGGTDGAGNFAITVNPALTCREHLYAVDTCPPFTTPQIGQVFQVMVCPAPAPLLSLNALAFLVGILGLVGVLGLRLATNKR